MIAGIAIMPSITRMTTASTARRKPLTSPMAKPITVDSAATDRPTISDTRPP